jgi:hypothetical protein
VTDEDVLVKWRARRGRITLSEARELEKLDKRFAHLRKHQRQMEADERARAEARRSSSRFRRVPSEPTTR